MLCILFNFLCIFSLVLFIRNKLLNYKDLGSTFKRIDPILKINFLLLNNKIFHLKHIVVVVAAKNCGLAAIAGPAAATDF